MNLEAGKSGAKVKGGAVEQHRDQGMGGTAVWHHLQEEAEKRMGEGRKDNRGTWELREREHFMEKSRKIQVKDQNR